MDGLKRNDLVVTLPDQLRYFHWKLYKTGSDIGVLFFRSILGNQWVATSYSTVPVADGLMTPKELLCKKLGFAFCSHFAFTIIHNRLSMLTMMKILTILVLLFPVTVFSECEELDCIPSGKACLEAPDECCDGLGCFGYGFYKKCIPPPACLPAWHDCSSGMNCCDDMICAQLTNGHYECQHRTLEVREANLVELNNEVPPTAAPTPMPKKEKNLVTTYKGDPVVTNVGCSLGDPHIYNFNGLAHDCQASGEFVLTKSTITQRQVQIHMDHFADRFSPGSAWSVTKGVAVQDEGDTPLVQISVPMIASTFAPNIFTQRQCKILFFVDGVQRDLNSGSGSPDVKVTYKGPNIEVLYTRSKMKITVNIGWASGCYLNVCAYVPNTDSMVGMLGSADGNNSNDWTTPDGKILPIPDSLQARMGKPGYDYCTQNWCVREESDSLFVHNENGIDFDDLMKCDLPFGDTLEEYLEKVDAQVLEFCGRNLQCITDAQLAGLESARSTVTSQAALTATCNAAGGECSVAKCCDGLLCVEKNGFMKECQKALPTCKLEFGDCSNSPCCGDLVCQENNAGEMQCRDIPSCMPVSRDCTHVDCCDGLTCVTKPDGFKTCMDLPKCMPKWNDCTLGVPCCAGLKCDQNSQCVDDPVCHDREWRDCSQTPCCDPLTCIVDTDGRNVCRQLPSCMKLWQSCEYRGCCKDGDIPLECVKFTDHTGRATSQCQPGCANNWGECSETRPCCNSNHTCKKHSDGRMLCRV